MDHESQVAAELNVLRALCDVRRSVGLRADLCRTMFNYRFADAEHQVVFESVCALLGRGQLSADQLSVNLINRGFPDTDMERYFVALPPAPEEAFAQISKLISSPGSSTSER